MKRSHIIFALLLSLILCPPNGIFAKNGPRKEVSRTAVMAVAVPEAAMPTGVCAGTFAHCVILTWTAPTKDTNGNALVGTLSYDIFRSTTSGSGYVKISNTPATTETFEDDAVVGGVTYFYVGVVYQTVNGTTTGPSANSTQVSATGLPIPPPNPLTGLQAVSH